MRRFIATASGVVLACLAGNTSASDWQDMGTDKGGHSVLLDRTSLVRDGNLVWAWTAQTLPGPMVIKDMTIVSFRMLVAFDCSNHLAWVKTSVAYSDANGAGKELQTLDMGGPQWSSPGDGPMNKALSYACENGPK